MQTNKNVQINNENSFLNIWFIFDLNIHFEFVHSTNFTFFRWFMSHCFYLHPCYVCSISLTAHAVTFFLAVTIFFIFSQFVAVVDVIGSYLQRSIVEFSISFIHHHTLLLLLLFTLIFSISYDYYFCIAFCVFPASNSMSTYNNNK